jgi:hypothetical protein
MQLNERVSFFENQAAKDADTPTMGIVTRKWKHTKVPTVTIVTDDRRTFVRQERDVKSAS